MAFYLVHATTKLQKVSLAGTVEDLTLPSGVTTSSTRRTRFAVLNDSVMAVHGPSLNLRIRTSDLATRPMSIPVPSTTATLAAGAAGALTGDYKYKFSFCELVSGALVSESPLSDATNTITLAAQRGSLTSIPVSTATGVNDQGESEAQFFDIPAVARLGCWIDAIHDGAGVLKLLVGVVQSAQLCCSTRRVVRGVKDQHGELPGNRLQRNGIALLVPPMELRGGLARTNRSA